MRIRILICENQHQYAKNLEICEITILHTDTLDITFYFNFVFKQLVNSSVASLPSTNINVKANHKVYDICMLAYFVIATTINTSL